ncbi:hypothetical protein [Halomarina oriensis]|uniref:Uncharacterized protein n=1 Tax=Halomarina oriensis TaxID=671145 RepID=A0A6B0GHN6_9EURY|nr:hypothetical protein [Halomarina oriensis]MWG33437.1 hypothetical protein [Halomarina oriensis]
MSGRLHERSRFSLGGLFVVDTDTRRFADGRRVVQEVGRRVEVASTSQVAPRRRYRRTGSLTVKGGVELRTTVATEVQATLDPDVVGAMVVEQ